jgi:hypothetical protein
MFSLKGAALKIPTLARFDLTTLTYIASVFLVAEDDESTRPRRPGQPRPKHLQFSFYPETTYRQSRKLFWLQIRYFLIEPNKNNFINLVKKRRKAWMLEVCHSQNNKHELIEFINMVGNGAAPTSPQK